ncbi:MAG: isopentenyl transferase family protein [Stellaceae bacterium]
MKKVAVFGNTGGGKSTLSIRLSASTGLPLHILDKIQYRSGGESVSLEEYNRAYQDILATDQWIIDGYGSLDSLWPRLKAADTLIYIDMPLPVHFWWVTKRLFTGRIYPPKGWPKNSPILKSSVQQLSRALEMPQIFDPKISKFHKADRRQQERLSPPVESPDFAFRQIDGKRKQL